MDFNLPASAALLERTPAVLDSLLRGLPEAWTQASEGGSTWTPIDILGHLIDSERVNWMPRARMIRESARHDDSAGVRNLPAASFPPFARDGHRRETEGIPLDRLLATFAQLRRENLAELLSWNLQPGDLARQGHHPAFGVVTLSQLLATWTTHDLTHLHQLSRTLAHQYREAVGPWVQYLGVLQCSGHSS